MNESRGDEGDVLRVKKQIKSDESIFPLASYNKVVLRLRSAEVLPNADETSANPRDHRLTDRPRCACAKNH